jgi:hypothetical protein
MNNFIFPENVRRKGNEGQRKGAAVLPGCGHRIELMSE